MRCALLALVLLSACSQPAAKQDDAPAADAAAPSDPERVGELAGTSWLMNDEPANTAPMMTFAADRASGTTGCNNWSGAYQRSDYGLAFENIAVTERGCESGVMETEAAFLQALRDTQGMRMEGEELVLMDLGGSENARFHRAN